MVYAANPPAAYAANWQLNIKVVMFDEATALTGAEVTMTNSTNGGDAKAVTCGGSGCWANYTQIADTETITVKVKWQNSWVNGSYSFAMPAENRNETAVAKVYQTFGVTWEYNDGLTAFVPTVALVTAPNSTDIAMTSFTGLTIQNGTWTAKNVTYWTSNVNPSPAATFAATADSQTQQISCQVYAITPVWKTSAGAALYTNPSSFKWTPANGTLSGALNAATAYWLQNGTTTVSAVTWKGTDVTPASATFNAASGSPTLNTKVYSITPLWKTNTGVALYEEPSSYAMTSPNSTLLSSLTPGTAYQLQNGSWSVSAVTWQGSNVTPSSGMSFVASAGSPTFNLKVYSVTPVWKASDGSALYENPSSFKFTPANSTLSGALSPATAYWLQNGTTTISTVTWQSDNVTPASGMTFDASSGSPTKNLKVYSVTPVWRDSLGTTPVIISSFKWTPPNSTLSGTLVSGTAYWLQNGTTTVSAVMYGGNDITPASPTFDASSGSPTLSTTYTIGTGSGGSVVTTTTGGVATTALQLALGMIPDYWFTPSAHITASVSVGNSGTTTQTMTVHYVLTDESGVIVYESTESIAIGAGGQTFTVTMPVTKPGTYTFLTEVTNANGIKTQTSQQVSVPVTTVYQGPLVIIAGIAVIAIVVVLSREHIGAAVERITP